MHTRRHSPYALIPQQHFNAEQVVVPAESRFEMPRAGSFRGLNNTLHRSRVRSVDSGSDTRSDDSGTWTEHHYVPVEVASPPQHQCNVFANAQTAQGPQQRYGMQQPPAYGCPLQQMASGPFTRLPPPAFAGSKAQARPAAAPAAATQARQVTRAPWRHDPYSTSRASRATPTKVAHGISHQPLVGRCRYIAWPQLSNARVTSVDATVLQSLPSLTIDQVKFELTGAQLRWVLHELTQVLAVNVERSHTGSFVVHLASDADVTKLERLHRKILFDHNGVWAPANDTESNAVAAYMASREFRQRGQRLPREPAVFSKTADRKSPRSPPGASGARRRSS